MNTDDRLKELFEAFKDMPDISCPTCSREIYCGKVEDMCSIRPCGILERRKLKKEYDE
jgi:hypothetical protein